MTLSNFCGRLGIFLAVLLCQSLAEPPSSYTYTVLPVIPSQKFEPVTESLFGGSRLKAGNEYGVPGNNLQLPETKFEPVKYEKAVLLDNFPTYSPANAGFPSGTYGPPSVNYEAPGSSQQQPAGEYGLPSAAPVQEYGAPSAAPAAEYGLPSAAPVAEYGLPSPSPAAEYGPPKQELDLSPSPVPSYGPPSTEYGAPGGSHGYKSSHVLAQLRERVHALGLNPLLTTDKQLERYLEGFNFRVERVIRWLTRTAIWRRSRGIDTITKNHPSDYLTTNLPYECTGYTHEGNPVMYVPIGRWNFRAALRMGSTSEIYNYMIRMLEEARGLTVGRVNPKNGWPVDQVVIILDAQGYSLKNLLSKRINYTLLRFFKAVSKHYPFFVKKWFVPRTPLLIRGMWQVVRKVVSRRTRDNFDVYTLFSTRGTNALMHVVPKNAIPVELGGTYIPRYVPPPIEVFQLPTFSAFGSLNANVNANGGYGNSIWQ